MGQFKGNGKAPSSPYRQTFRQRREVLSVQDGNRDLWECFERSLKALYAAEREEKPTTL